MRTGETDNHRQVEQRDPRRVRLRPQVAADQLRLDVVLLADQPVHRAIAVIGAGIGHSQVGAQGRLARAAMAAARHGQIRATPSFTG
jgi:hypothetical protein